MQPYITELFHSLLIRSLGCFMSEMECMLGSCKLFIITLPSAEQLASFKRDQAVGSSDRADRQQREGSPPSPRGRSSAVSPSWCSHWHRHRPKPPQITPTRDAESDLSRYCKTIATLLCCIPFIVVCSQTFLGVPAPLYFTLNTLSLQSVSFSFVIQQ